MNRNQQADFEITTRSGAPVARVEIKNVPRLTLESAADIRGDLVGDDPIGASRGYFLVVAQDRAFLWEPASGPTSSEPATSFAMQPVLREYLTDRELDGHLRGGELEIAILQWLNDLTRGRGVIPREPVALSAFAERLRGGTVQGGRDL